METTDYILADRFHILSRMEKFYTEKVLRLPDGFLCYEPPSYAPETVELPAKKNGFITFGCFNNSTKINDQLLDIWARILVRVPKSKLVLKYSGMDSPLNKERILSRLSNCGIDNSRIIIEGKSPHAELLERYNDVDIALDTYPYSGCTTTCESLWMGVPVVTCPGETFSGRHTLSLLSNVGLPRAIAKDFDDYVEVAVSIAEDIDGLACVRAGLREQMAKSPPCDGPRFARGFSAVMRNVWNEYVNNTSKG